MKVAIKASVLGIAAFSFFAPSIGRAQDSNQEVQNFIAIHKNGDVFFDGQDTGEYCVYDTVKRLSRTTGRWVNRRVKHCGRGLFIE